MSTQTSPQILQRNLSSNGRYGITERKKAEIDSLTLQVQDAQYQVELYQSIVNSMNEKVAYFQNLLTVADNTRTQTFSNQNLVNQLVYNENVLLKNSAITFNEIEKAEAKTDVLAINIKITMDKLIYCVEVLNKLSIMVMRKKAVNPLISDDLINMLTTAGKDANNVISLALVALKSTFAAQASNMESKSAIELGYIQTQDMLKLLTNVTVSTGTDTKNISLHALLNEAYENAKNNYAVIEQALTRATRQLNQAQRDLNKAQVNLTSLQSGLAAANAAALAS
ncbi:hypothetical protein E0W68_10935 [Flavobacterium salilacus subsp. salilacus]|uniref:hypothetical protein n=1 Tax=Flavobacterium TaxID=237 RepID=UPI00107556FD|nr:MULTISPECIES: hypothetical protein [Flavobacterium]KAF2517479.1 hypothetical protein E0W68_10935 [Flavobacterium salilacus subsp. salilacus]MBE1615623.1 hypothetical protein [Flavobacterium sp. SaA2.13]